MSSRAGRFAKPRPKNLAIPLAMLEFCDWHVKELQFDSQNTLVHIHTHKFLPTLTHSMCSATVA